MNRWMMAAAGLLLLTTYVHVFLGGPEIHDIIQTSTLTADVRAVAAVLWHAITVILLLFALACAYLARRENTALAGLIVAIQVGFAGLFLWIGTSQLGTLWIMPQWVIFLTISAVILIGARRQPSPV